jgi:hypothetical protein
MRRAIFTVCANHLVPHATVLLQSVNRFLPDFDRFLVLADEPHGAVVYPPDCTVLPARGLGVPDFAGFAFRYDSMEFSAALKPFMFLHLLRDQGYTECLYFDPDIELFGPLPTVTSVLGGDASLLLTPHLLTPVEGAEGADDVSVLRAGVYNLGFLGARATDEAFEVLAWWARWLRWQCVNDQPIGLFVDQKFIDLVPGFAPGARILRDPTLNVAGWNVRQRDFVPDASGGPAVGGRPLGFFHYSGLVGSCADHAGGQPPAFPDGALPNGLQRFVDGYAARLRAAGDGWIPRGSYAYGRFASGTPIPAMARRMFRDDHPAWPGDPFETFEAWMHLPAVGAAVGLGSAIPSLIMQWLQARTPAVARISLDRSEGAAQLVQWWLAQGGDMGLDPRLLAPQALAVGRRAIAVRACCPPRDPARPDISIVAPFRDESAASTVGRALGFGLVRRVERLEKVDSLSDQASSGRVLVFSVPWNQLSSMSSRLRVNSYKVFVPGAEWLPDVGLLRDGLREIDEIWAPTQFMQGRIVGATDVPVLHMPVPLIWSAAPMPCWLRPLLPEGPYVLAMADALPGEGGLPAAVAAYGAAFGLQRAPGRPALVIRAAGEPGRQSWLDSPEDAVVVDQPMSGPDELTLIAGAACLLSAQRGEAIGFSIARAMACGVPVVATDYGGSNDLLTPDTGYPVDFELRRHGDVAMAEIDPQHARWQLREVFDRPDEARRRAANASRLLATRYDPPSIANRQVERLGALGLL